jgi:transposase
MSLQAEPLFDIPELTAEIAQAAFPKGNIYMQMRDNLGVFFDDEQFTDLFSHTGQPAIAPWRLALVTIMQFAENLTDRQAADAVRARIDWKYALSLEMQDAGFHYSVLSEFRGRLMVGGREEVLLEAMLDCFKEKKLLKPRGKQRTDSTYIVAAVRHLNQLELVHEALRHALNELAVQAPAWLKKQVNADWFDMYSQRTSNYLLPKKEEERQSWAERVGRDGFFLLEQVYLGYHHAELSELPAVEILRQVWIQNFYQDDGQVRLRQKKEQPPSAKRITSPYELEARTSTKRDTTWTGYKVHLTETCDADSPNLIINVETRISTEPDHTVTGIIHDHLALKDCLATEHFVDQGYTSVDHLVQAREKYGVELMGAVPDDNSWQAHREGYDSRHFMIDWANETAICPQNHASCNWSLAKTRSQRPVMKIKFRRKDCAACPQLHLCTNNKEKRRTLTILAPQSHFEAQQEARRRQDTIEFKETCQVRAGVEGTISQTACTFGIRQARYRGMAKTHLQHLATATAVNLFRVIAWLNEVPRSVTPISHFARLAV